jgi:plastocyanin
VLRSALLPRAACLFLAAGAALADQSIQIGPGISFSPANITLVPGETVTWNWAAGPHSSTSDLTTGPEVWDSGIQFAGHSFSHTFTTPGTYLFYCKVHSFPGGTAMNGSVVVAALTPTPTPPPTVTPTVAPTAVPTPAAGPAPIPTLRPGSSAILVGLLAGTGILVLLGLRRR